MEINIILIKEKGLEQGKQFNYKLTKNKNKFVGKLIKCKYTL